MRALRSPSAFDLFDRLEQQLSQQRQAAERLPAAEVHETPEAYVLLLELPGVDKAAIDVKATDRSLQVSEFRYGTWSRSFRFPVAIDRDQLEAVYRDGLLTITAPKTRTVSSVRVTVEG